MSATVLSTKKLADSQKELLLNAGIGLVEKQFISIVPIDFAGEDLLQNLIVTSKNTIARMEEKLKESDLRSRKFFCVGEKTADFLKSRGYFVIEKADYGADLATKIVENHKGQEFQFFCGKKRNSDLPEKLRRHNIRFEETEIYDTILTPTKIDRIFEGVLFFSPSAVKSYCLKNSLSGSTAFCIGTTTSSEAEKHCQNIVLATKPTIENVIVQVIRHLG